MGCELDEGEGAVEAEDEGEVEGQGEVEVESDVEQRNADDPDPGESEGEREQSSQEVDIGDHREESEGKYTDTDEKEELISRRRNVIESGSERSEENHYPDNEDEVNQAISTSRSPEEEEEHTNIAHSAVRNVFGDSDEEEEETDFPNDIQHESNVPLEIPLRPPPARPEKTTKSVGAAELIRGQVKIPESSNRNTQQQRWGRRSGTR
ncbi:protein LEO1 homolog [Pyrus x bretschneideri]|uniref:protein LEO1 homolog n=1 Tax=Pyrus x bretschneideri TaxID=225117 RepID=UPI00202F330C|nr:protein LEO1 homolog [Pyrus x bretschneideri]